MFEPLIPPRQFNVRTDDFAQSSLHASFYPQRPQQPETPDDYLYLQPIATSARMIKSIAPKGEIADGRSSWVPETARVQPNKNKLTLQKTTRKSHKVEKKRDCQGPRSPHYKSILPYLIGSTSHSPGTKRTERDPFMDAKAVSEELAAFERNAGSAAPPAGGHVAATSIPTEKPAASSFRCREARQPARRLDVWRSTPRCVRKVQEYAARDEYCTLRRPRVWE